MLPTRPSRLVPLLLLGACVSAGPVRQADVVLPTSYESTPTASAAAPLDRWWTMFGDPELTGLVERALVRSSDAREAAARLLEARAIRRAALADYAPQGDLRLNGQGQQNRILRSETIEFPGAGDGGVNPFAQGGLIGTGTANFDISWELDLLGRRAAARREAEASLAAAHLDAEAARSALAANVADALFAVRGLATQREDARATARIQDHLRRLAAERVRRGLAVPEEVSRIDADLAQSQAELTRLDAEQRATARALLVLVGDAAAPLAGIADTPALPPLPETPALMPGELLARRPDVRAAGARLVAAAGRLRLDELALFPRLTLQPGVGLSATSGGAFDATTLAWTMAAGLTVPILDRPRLIAQLRGQEARVEQAVIAYERAVQTAFSETDQALVRLAADRRRIAELARGEHAADEAVAAARLRYRQGLGDLADVLDAERSQRSARSLHTAARVDALRRSVQLFKAAGGGWTPGAAGQEAGR